MRSTHGVLVVVAAAVVGSCTSQPASQAPSPQPSTQGQVSPPPAPVTRPADQGAPSLPGPGGPGGPGGRRPNPIQQDSARRAQVDSIMRTIAGREQEPASKVFKNVKLLKDMPAAAFLKNMDENYGRGLGMSCGNCHVLGKFDEDTRKNKRVARDMQEMTDYINTVRLANIKELDEDYVKVTCVTCHLGSGHPKATMPVPVPLPAAVAR